MAGLLAPASVDGLAVPPVDCGAAGGVVVVTAGACEVCADGTVVAEGTFDPGDINR